MPPNVTVSSDSIDGIEEQEQSLSKCDTFKFSQLQVTLCAAENLQEKPSISSLKFGQNFTDHMFQVEWREDDGGWSTPKILPMTPLSIHPGAKVFHYACELYEGMKAYRGQDGKVRLFRPELNMQRLLRGAQRAMLPQFDAHEFLKCLKKLVQIEQDWIPSSETSSLYIRPTFIGTGPALGINRTTRGLLYVILCPVGPYFDTGFKPISLLADPRFCRAWPGGCGDTKLGANYAPTVFIQKFAEQLGCQQVLWLYGHDHQITEAGTMNIFIVIEKLNGEKELITPALDGLILPGVTRQSILDLTRQWNEFQVTERKVTMTELVQLSLENRLLEVFGAGTACIVCPVSTISYMGAKLNIQSTSRNPDDLLCSRILKNLTDIYYGKIEHPWSLILD